MRVLFIGGTGVISAACTPLAVARGIELFHLNRGTRPAPAGVTTLRGDIRTPAAVAALLTPYRFDAVVEWIAYRPEHIETDLALFAGKTDQYVFISTTATYQKPAAYYRMTESTPQHNPCWEYAQLKIACEERLRAAYRDTGIPMTIVRPSHTYGETKIPIRSFISTKWNAYREQVWRDTMTPKEAMDAWQKDVETEWLESGWKDKWGKA